MKKRLLVLLLALLMVFSFAFVAYGCPKKGPEGGDDDNKDTPTKQTVVVWSMSNEVVDLLKYFELVNDKYEFDITFINNDDGSYETALDSAFRSQEGPDLFLTDVDYTKKYVNSPHSADLVSFYEKLYNNDAIKGYDKVRAELEKDMYSYTLDIGTRIDNDKKELKAVSFQVTPGAMFYRADMFLTLIDNGLLDDYENFNAWKAEAGINSTATIENYPGGWSEDDKQKLDAAMQEFVGNSMDTFLEATKKVSENKYNEGKADEKKILMVNNLDDIKRVFYASREAFIQGDKVVIDANLVKMLDFGKDIYPYTHKGSQWGDSWYAGMKAENKEDASYKTLAFFLPTWGLFYVLENEDTAGLWRMIEGPQAYYWGGTYCMINSYSKNKDAAFEVLNFLTSLPFMQARSAFSGDVMNSKDLNNALAGMEVLSNPFLGGQNHFATFNDLAAKVKADNVTEYDSTVDRVYSDVMRRYAGGDIKTLEDAKKEIEDRLESDISNKQVEFRD